ncbi:MAG: amino acid ABC transporter permease [Chloroflexota bacterium]
MRLQVIWDNLPLLGAAMALTVLVAVGAILLGLALGLVTALARMGPVRPLRWLAVTYIEVIRNTPALVQLFVLYYGLPELGVRVAAIPCLVLALGINNGAYLAEIIRGGLRSVRRGQLEAAAAVGLAPRTTFRDVLLPQSVRAIYPAVTNQCIQIVLATSLGTIVGVPELTNQAMFINSRTFRTWEVLLALTIGYAVLTWTIGLISRAIGWRLERAYR